MKITGISFGIILILLFLPGFIQATSLRDVVINEIAWSGTRASSADEWIELKNNTNSVVDLTNWGIYEQGSDVLIISLEGVIQPASFYLIERTDDNTIADVIASQLPKAFGGSGLSNAGEYLILKDTVGNIIDSVNASGGWFAGSAAPDYFSMERINSLESGDSAVNWKNNDGAVRNGKDAEGNPINGTSLAVNSEGSGTLDQSGAGDNPSANGEENSLSNSNSSSNSPVENNPPQANAGDDVFTFLGETIQFDASKSSDPDGDKLSFSWNLGNGEIIKEKIFGYVYQFPGKYAVTLTVSDGKNESFDGMVIEVIPAGIKISEFLASPIGSDEEGEWIEVYNNSDYLVDLGGWQLDDMADGGSKPWTFPARTFLQPKKYLVISREVSKISLNNDSDAIRLIYPNGIAADEVVYEKAKEGVSGAFLAGKFFWSALPTPGMPNILETEVIKSAGGQAINSYFVENFEKVYQKLVYKNTSSDGSGQIGADKNLVIVGNSRDEGGVIKEIEIQENSSSLNKFVASKNMLAASAGINISKINLILFLLFSFGAGLVGFYAFRVYTKRGDGFLKNKEKWDILVDE